MRFRDLTELPDEQIELGRAALLLATIEEPDLDVEAWMERLDELGSWARDRAAGMDGDLERHDLRKAARIIDRLARLEPTVPRHRYDRGVLRLHAGDPRSLEDLEHYLAEETEASDREEVEALLAKARRKLTAVH